MIPKRIQPYFKMKLQNKTSDNSLIEGMFTCCNAQDFEVFVVGKIQHGPFSKMGLFPLNDKMALEVRCKKCGKHTLVFDSSCDGYEQCGNNRITLTPPKQINCKKCLSKEFSVVIKYEYPDIHELEQLEISEIDNAFTWVWITLECNKCGTRYKNFIDYETT